MQGGRVVRIRVSPKDCMRVVDALGKMGVDIPAFQGSLSFSHATKRVLEACLVALERDGIIPTRDGFEYSTMLSAFPSQDDALKSRAKQIQFTKLEEHPSYKAQPIVPESHERKARRVRYEELMFKREADEINFTQEELLELVALIEEFQA